MTTSGSNANHQRVQDALADLLEADKHNNSYQYFHAADLHEINPDVSAAMAGAHLREIEDESPLDNGIIVERYTDSRSSATLWIVRRQDE